MAEDLGYNVAQVGEWFLVQGHVYLHTDNASGRALFSPVCYGSFKDKALADELRDALQNAYEASLRESLARMKFGRG